MKLFITDSVDMGELVSVESPIKENGGAKLSSVIYGLFLKLKDSPLVLRGFIENEAYQASVSGQEGKYGYALMGLDEPIGASTLAHIMILMGLELKGLLIPKKLSVSWANSTARKRLGDRISVYSSKWAKDGSPYRGFEAMRLHEANNEASKEA